MWKCPECSAEFVTRNLWHSCGRYSVEGFLKGKNERAVELFWHLVREFEAFGELKLHPVKTSVALMTTVRFARVNRLTKNGLAGHLWLKERVESLKFYRIEHLSGDDHIHHFRFDDRAFIDDEFRGLMRKAYTVGMRHLT